MVKAAGSSAICSASLNLLKKPQNVMRKVKSTIRAAVKCSRRAAILMIESLDGNQHHA
jgi:hypothetical protein